MTAKLRPAEVTLGLRAVRAAACEDDGELLRLLRGVEAAGLSPFAVMLSVIEYAGRLTTQRPGWADELGMAIQAAEIDELDTPDATS